MRFIEAAVLVAVGKVEIDLEKWYFDPNGDKYINNILTVPKIYFLSNPEFTFSTQWSC